MSRALFLLLVGWLAAVSVAAAQRVHLETAVEHPTVEALRGILESKSYLLIDRDTVLPASSHLAGDVVIVGATVRLDGSVDGSVALLNGTLFARPGARISGPVVSVGGIVLRSSRATTGDTLTVPLDIDVTLTRSGRDYTLALLAPPPPPRLRPTGFFGFGLPTYDRVNGLSVRGGAELRLGADSLSPLLNVSGVLRTARGSPGGTATLAAPLGHPAIVTLAVGRETRSSDRWIRGDLENSLAALFVRSDARDYYDADFGALTLSGSPPPPLIQGESYITPRLELRIERDRSLRARDVFTFFGDEPWRANPSITDGRIASVIPSAEVGWRGSAAAAGITAGVELGRALREGSWTEGSDFAQLTVDGRWGMIGLWDTRSACAPIYSSHSARPMPPHSAGARSAAPARSPRSTSTTCAATISSSSSRPTTSRSPTSPFPSWESPASACATWSAAPGAVARSRRAGRRISARASSSPRSISSSTSIPRTRTGSRSTPESPSPESPGTL